MSDSENEEDIQNIDILGQEEAEFESEDNFEIREMTNNILEKNDFFIEKGNDKVMNEIIKFHEKLGFNDDELFLLLSLFLNLLLKLAQAKKSRF